ncbi:hypothetical protein BJ741DRAFT_634142 [Chytriomyces cf. hyalinus JEL632]|nr:hypothetical protein BJ741DRAFT_634142 [Chytriomyces cf. hyalinus JEL632]
MATGFAAGTWIPRKCIQVDAETLLISKRATVLRCRNHGLWILAGMLGSLQRQSAFYRFRRTKRGRFEARRNVQFCLDGWLAALLVFWRLCVGSGSKRFKEKWGRTDSSLVLGIIETAGRAWRSSASLLVTVRTLRRLCWGGAGCPLHWV